MTDPKDSLAGPGVVQVSEHVFEIAGQTDGETEAALVRQDAIAFAAKDARRAIEQLERLELVEATDVIESVPLFVAFLTHAARALRLGMTGLEADAWRATMQDTINRAIR